MQSQATYMLHRKVDNQYFPLYRGNILKFVSCHQGNLTVTIKRTTQQNSWLFGRRPLMRSQTTKYAHDSELEVS
jgi:hypothetical protein